MTTPLAPPGWYPDTGANAQRYFDGFKWTDHFAPFNPPSGPGPLPPPKWQRKRRRRLRPTKNGLFIAFWVFLGLSLGWQLQYHSAGPGLYSHFLRCIGWMLSLMGLFSTVVGIINVVAAIVLSVQRRSRRSDRARELLS
jgi:Protein of unknown function (DUF2510)